MVKTEQQFSEPGFWIAEGVLSSVECDRILVELYSAKTKRGRAGARHLMSHPAVVALATDPRLMRLVRQELGECVVPYRATLFEKSGRANWLVVWHQDTALPLESRFDRSDWGPWSVKGGIQYAHAPAWALSRIFALRLHLDAATTENGPLRVLPGSHVAGVLADDDVFEYARIHQAFVCTVGRGGVMGMRPLLIHSSSKALTSDPRRVLHIEYAESRDLAEGIRLSVA